MRNKTKVINIGNVKIGRGNPIAIQSMTNAKNIDDIINQINLLSDSGCEIIRCAVADFEMAQSLKIIKRNIKIPLVADIHFDYRLAIEAIKNGADKIRINPGNIGSNDRVKLILDTAKQYQIPIRIGVNAGSLEKSILKKYNGVTMQGLAQSALNFIDMFNAYDFDNIVVSVKSSSVPLSIGAYKILSENTDYPLHVGITEAGINTVKSSVGSCLRMIYVNISAVLKLDEEQDFINNFIKSLTFNKSGFICFTFSIKML